jgi:hypothetical protein
MTDYNQAETIALIKEKRIKLEHVCQVDGDVLNVLKNDTFANKK